MDPSEAILTVLCDNMVSASGLMGEHGFSLLIEKESRTYLFDTGPGLSLPFNVKRLGKDLKGLGHIFLSHGHYDHTGGLRWAVRHGGRGVKIVAHPDIFSPHMVCDSPCGPEGPRYIGCPFQREELEQEGAEFVFVEGTREIIPGLWFVAGMDLDPVQMPKDSRLVIPRGPELVPDPLRDDASLLMETPKGPVLILGCAHAGVLNILAHVQKEFGLRHLHAVLGGTHLMFAPPDQTRAFLEALRALSVDLVAVSHCTGWKAMIWLAKGLGERFSVAGAGSVFRF